jgi:hypothetical protein
MATGTVTQREDGITRFDCEGTGRWVEAKRRDSSDRRPASWHVRYSDGREMAGEWYPWSSLYHMLARWVMGAD